MKPLEQCGNCRQCQESQKSINELFAEEKPAPLTPEQEKFKRALYEKMQPRRRKFIDRLGYDNWDPFQEPKQPLDLRKDRTERTLQQLISDFMKASNGYRKDPAWQKGVSECALGIIQKNEKFQGIFDFCLWYAKLLEEEGKDEKTL